MTFGMQFAYSLSTSLKHVVRRSPWYCEFRDDKLWYLVFEKFPVTLDAVMANPGTMGVSSRQIKEIILQVAIGTKCKQLSTDRHSDLTVSCSNVDLHTEYLRHTDISPENIEFVYSDTVVCPVYEDGVGFVNKVTSYCSYISIINDGPVTTSGVYSVC